MSKNKPKIKPHQELESRQELFCHEYLKDRNATQAAIRAGYSAKTSYVQGARVLGYPAVQYKINKLIDEQIGKIKVEVGFVIKELVKLCSFDIQDIFKDDGSIKDVKDMPEVIRKSIASVEVDELFEGQGKNRKWIGYTKKIKFWPKEKALELLGKHLKMFSDVNVAPGGTLIFADVKIEQQEAPALLTDINNRLSNQFSKQ